MRIAMVLGLFLGGVGMAAAGERGVPSEELVQRLIAEEAEIRPGGIKVAVILPGKAKMGDDFETDDAARVVFIWSVVAEGRAVRRVEERTFYWNEKFGWFFFTPSNPRGGQAVDICSETQGILRIR